MQTNRKLFTLLLLLLSCSSLWAQQEQFRYKRAIEGADHGWHSIPLPAELFGALSQPMADIRIWGITAAGDTLEMPYLLEVRDEQVQYQEIPFQLINQVKNETGHFYTLAVPQAAALNEIRLQFGNANFDWRVALEGSHNQRDWFTVLDNYRIVSIENDFTDYSFTTLRFPLLSYAYLRLHIKSKEQPELMPVMLYHKTVQAADVQPHELLHFSSRVDKQRKQSLADLELTQAVPVSKLTLHIADTHDYYRPISILYANDSSQSAEGWRYLYKPLFSGTLSSLEESSFSFPATITKRLRVLIENGNNLPLKLEGAAVQGYAYALTTRLQPAESYWLVYGNPLAAAPEYDISLFTNKIPDSLELLQLGPQQALFLQDLTAASPLFGNKLWLWVIMLALIGMMGWFTLKMMKSAQTNKQS